MTALATRPAGRHQPAVTSLRLARAAWQRHRLAFVAIAVVFGATALMLIVEGVHVRIGIDRGHLARCFQTSFFVGCPGSAALKSFLLDSSWYPGYAQDLAVLAPLIVAVFAGVPWLTREFETGSFRYTWAQEAGRTRWLLGTFAPLTVTAAVAAALLGGVYDWWNQDAQWVFGDLPLGWDWLQFGMGPTLLAAFTVLAMSLALLTGVLVRRTVPAMAVCAGACVGCYALAQSWLRNWLTTLGPVIERNPDNLTAPGISDLVLRTFTTAPDGRVVASTPDSDVIPEIGHLSASQNLGWLAQHHYATWIAYQPQSRIAEFQSAEAAIVLAAAAIIVVAATWLLRRIRAS
jgi:hypothetical protein